MTKQELIKAVTKEAAFTNIFTPTTAQVERVYTAIWHKIQEELEAGRSVTISGFGTFKPLVRDERICRNPQTGEEIHVPSCTVVKFTMSSSLKDALND